MDEERLAQQRDAHEFMVELLLIAVLIGVGIGCFLLWRILEAVN